MRDAGSCAALLGVLSLLTPVWNRSCTAPGTCLLVPIWFDIELRRDSITIGSLLWQNDQNRYRPRIGHDHDPKSKTGLSGTSRSKASKSDNSCPIDFDPRRADFRIGGVSRDRNPVSIYLGHQCTGSIGEQVLWQPVITWITQKTVYTSLSSTCTILILHVWYCKDGLYIYNDDTNNRLFTLWGFMSTFKNCVGLASNYSVL